MAHANQNPWEVQCISSFNFLCCPECAFRTKEKSIFEAHAIENHPKSKTFFKPDPMQKEEISINLLYCCPECNYKSDDMNKFQSHAMENHPASSTFFNNEKGNV